MDSLFLDPVTWDLTLDASGNIALCSAAAPEPTRTRRLAYAIAQNVACACRTFAGEVWYDTRLGVPYLPRILGRAPGTPPPSPQFIRAQLIAAGMTINDVRSVRCFLSGIGIGRNLGGQLQITTADGILAVAQAEALTGTPWYVSAVSAEAAA